MTDTPVISIVTPSYNQAEFIEETLVSVLSQEGDFFLDYIVMDGGSSDDSPGIIKAYAERLEKCGWPVRCRGIRYRWVSEKDRGQADALMKGFALAEGGILAWLNSDDIYQPGALQAAADFFRDNADFALLYGDAQYCDAAGQLTGRYPTEDFDLDKLAWFNFICQPSTFFRKEAFEAVGGLDLSLHFAMDYDLFVRMGKQFKVRYLPRDLSKYRLHESSKTVRNEVLAQNHEEVLLLARKHFGWAPLNRVYGYCHYACLARFPDFLTRFRPLCVGIALLCTISRYLWLNRGMRRADLKMLSSKNFRKMFKERSEILHG